MKNPPTTTDRDSIALYEAVLTLVNTIQHAHSPHEGEMIRRVLPWLRAKKTGMVSTARDRIISEIMQILLKYSPERTKTLG